MNKELIVRSNSNIIDYALLKEGRLVELHKNENSKQFNVGDIVFAKIKKVVTGLNAAFVDVGHEKEAFLHYHDLGPQLKSLIKFTNQVRNQKSKDYFLKSFSFEKDIDKNGSIDKVLKKNQQLLVQIVKEPISTKGPRISSELTLAGRYIVLAPFSNRISVSQKIKSNDEKERLKRLMQSITPKGFGVIVRTVAQGHKVADLDADLQNLITKWQNLCKDLPQINTPTTVANEDNRSSAILRDIFDERFSLIMVNNESIYHQMREYIQTISPEKANIVKLHDSRTPLFEKYGIERQIKTSFGKTVSMPKGAYLVIEHTEAMHVIDVNSGNQSNKEKSQAETALEVNLLSASEIARQLRLRDMGGIIVVDFIDMTNAEHRKTLFNHLRDEMKDDKAKHKVLPPTRFGLIQITRQRVRPVNKIETREENPNGNGNSIDAPIKVIEAIDYEIEMLLKEGHKNLTLNIHPFIAAFLTKGFPSHRFNWFLKYKTWIGIQPRDAYTYMEYHFFDKKGKEIQYN